SRFNWALSNKVASSPSRNSLPAYIDGSPLVCDGWTGDKNRKPIFSGSFLKLNSDGPNWSHFSNEKKNSTGQPSYRRPTLAGHLIRLFHHSATFKVVVYPEHS